MTFWDKAPNDRGAALILTIGWSAVLLALAGVVSSAVLQQVRPSDNAELSYQAWAAAEAGVDDARARLSADTQYYETIQDFNQITDPDLAKGSLAALNNPALTGWVDVPGSEEGGPEFTYHLDVSEAEEFGRIRVTSSGRAREGDETVRTVDVLVTKRLSTDYAYLSNSEAFPFDLPGAYGASGRDGSSETSLAVARELCATGASGDEPTYWYQWKPWPGRPEGGPSTATDPANPASIEYGAEYRNSRACLHSLVTSKAGGSKGITFDGPAHTNDVWYIDNSSISDIASDEVFKGEVTSSCPDSVCDPRARWVLSQKSDGNQNVGPIGGGLDPGTYEAELEGTKQPNQPWNPAYSPVLEMPSDRQLEELKSIAREGGCVFSGPTRIRMTTENGLGKVHITSPDTSDGSLKDFCKQENKSFEPLGDSVHPTVTLDYATMVNKGFNGVFYVEQSTAEDPATCRVKDGGSFAATANYPWIIPEDEQVGGYLRIVGNDDTVKGLPDQSTKFQSKGLNLKNTISSAFQDFAALADSQESPADGDAYYVRRGTEDLDADEIVEAGNEEYVVYEFSEGNGNNPGEWKIVPVAPFYDEWTHFPQDQCRNGHVYLEAPHDGNGYLGGGYTGRYTIAADGDIVITDDIYESSATANVDDTSDNWGVPLETSDNQLGLVPDRWLYIYKLKASAPGKDGKGGDQNGISETMRNLLLNVAVLAKDKCLALQDFSSNPQLGNIKVVGALAQNSSCRLMDGSSGYNGAFTIDYDDRYKRLGPPPFMPVLSQEPWQAKVWSETTVRRDFEAKQKVKSPTEPPLDSGSTFTWQEFLPEGGQLLYVRLLTGAGSVTANTDEGTVSYTPSGGADTAVIEFVVKTSEGLTVGQTITYGS